MSEKEIYDKYWIIKIHELQDIAPALHIQSTQSLFPPYRESTIRTGSEFCWGGSAYF